jgi:molybdopterin/thiamine biosynthesis adenylyltransferase
MEKDIYFKQKNLFNPENPQPTIIVYGAGSIGSHLVMGLAKTGFKNITVIDYDVIEEDNLPAQSYPYSLVTANKGLLKIDALKTFIKDFTGTTINTLNEKITSNSTINLSMNTIHVCCFDNIEGRKTLFNHFKDFPIHYLDGRIGGFNIEKYYVNMLNDKEVEDYEQTLEGEFVELECGNKALWSVNSLLASKLIADIIKLTKNLKPVKELKGNLMSDLTISKEE